MSRTWIQTAESVTAGHADKICDLIADKVLDAILGNDQFARVACEVMTTTGMVIVTGQITTKCYVDITAVVRDTIRDVGYNDPTTGFDYNSCAILVMLEEQSGDVSIGVDRKGAGDQGVCMGYATTEGKSVVIRQKNVAKVLGYAVYDNESGMPLSTIGEFKIEAELAVPMLSSYRAATKEIFGAGMQSTQIEGGQWLAYMPGDFTTLMTLFSTDPASEQLETLEELHMLFERANRTLLSNPPVDPDELVFPHKYFLGRHQ